MQLIPSGLGCADRARQMKNNYRFNRVNNKNMIQVAKLIVAEQPTIEGCGGIPGFSVNLGGCVMPILDIIKNLGLYPFQDSLTFFFFMVAVLGVVGLGLICMMENSAEKKTKKNKEKQASHPDTLIPIMPENPSYPWGRPKLPVFHPPVDVSPPKKL